MKIMAEVVVISEFGRSKETKNLEVFTKKALLKKLYSLIDKKTTCVQVRIWRIESEKK